jgi:hypothetical protein
VVLKWLWGIWGDLFDSDNPEELIESSTDDPSPIDEEVWGFVFRVLTGIFLLVAGKKLSSSKNVRRKKGNRISNVR